MGTVTKAANKDTNGSVLNKNPKHKNLLKHQPNWFGFNLSPLMV